MLIKIIKNKFLLRNGECLTIVKIPQRMYQFNFVFVSMFQGDNKKDNKRRSRDWLLKYAGITTFAIFCRYENNPYL